MRVCRHLRGLGAPRAALRIRDAHHRPQRRLRDPRHPPRPRRTQRGGVHRADPGSPRWDLPDAGSGEVTATPTPNRCRSTNSISASRVRCSRALRVPPEGTTEIGRGQAGVARTTTKRARLSGIKMVVSASSMFKSVSLEKRRRLTWRLCSHSAIARDRSWRPQTGEKRDDRMRSDV